MKSVTVPKMKHLQAKTDNIPTMASSVNNPWIELTNNNYLWTVSASGTYKDRYIVFEARHSPHVGLIYDMQTKTLVGIPNPPYCNDVDRDFHREIVVNGVLYQLLPTHPIRRISLSPMSKWEETRTIIGLRNYTLVSSGSSIFIFDFDMKMHCYDTIADKISTYVTKIPGCVLSDAVAAMTNRLYAMGRGHGTKLGSNSVYVFNIATQSLSQAPPLPWPISGCSATTVLDRWIIYVEDQDVKICVFDTFTQEWSQRKVDLSRYCGAYSCITFGSHIIFFGRTKLVAIDIKHIIPDWTYEHIKHFILMRKLVDEGRAIPIIPFNRQDKVVQALMMDMSLDVFRNVLSFLTYLKSEMPTWSNHDWRNSLFTKVAKNYYSCSEELESESDTEDEE